jgi:hypothetical protein
MTGLLPVKAHFGFAAARNLVATGAHPTLVKPVTNELDL